MSELPDWLEVPNVPLHDLRQGAGELTRPFTQQQLLQIGRELIEQFLKKVVQAVVGFFIPGGGTAFEQLSNWAIDNILNIPLTALGAIFDNNGKILTDLLSIPADIITGLPTAVLSGMQSLIDMIVNGLEGTPGHIGNPITMVFTGLNGLREGLAGLGEVADSLALYFQDMASLLVQIVQQGLARPVLGTIDVIMDAVSFWVFGWFHRTETAHTAQNAGIATLRGELNARLAEIGTGTSGWVDNFDSPGYSLTTNYTVNTGEVTSVLGTRDGTNYVLQPPTSNRSTMYHNVEASTGQVDIEMAVSNLAQYGRCALWIGGHSASVAGGLDSGTLLVRIDNGFTDNDEQRLQIYTVGITGTQAPHGNLYVADMGTWHDGDLIRLRKDETTQLHRVFLNDVPVCEFDDDLTNIVTTGAGSRFGGWRQNIDSSSGPNVGPDLDLIHLYDWTV